MFESGTSNELLDTEARMKRPERAEAPSPGQRPGYNSNQQYAL